jgi:hypothetical protein
VIQRRIVFSSDSLNDEPFALGFAPKSGSGHAAIREGNLRRHIETQRRIRIDGIGLSVSACVTVARFVMRPPLSVVAD